MSSLGSVVVRIAAQGVGEYKAELDQAAKHTTDAAQRVETSAKAISTNLGAVGLSAKQTAAALRGVPAQMTDIITSLQGGQAPLTVLLQQGGQLKDMFGGTGNAARALGGYVLGLVNPFSLAAAGAGVLALAAYQGSQESVGYAKSLALSGNAAGKNAGQMGDMALAIGKVVGTQHAAAGALSAIAGTGQVAGRNLQAFSQVAVQMERTVGQSVADTAEHFAELARDPVKASLKLNESMNYLTAATYAQIKAADELGDKEQAASIAQHAYADAQKQRMATITENLGLLEKAWRGVGDMAAWSWDKMLGVGRKDSVAKQIEDVTAELERRTKKGPLNDAPGMAASHEKGLAGLRQQMAILHETVRLDERSGQAKADSVVHEKAKIAWMQEGEKYQIRDKKLEEEINRIRFAGLQAGAKQKDIEERIAAARQKAAEKPKERKPDAWSTDVLRSYTSAMDDLGKMQDEASAKADGLSKTQAKLREVMGGPQWQAYNRQQREQIIYSAALAQTEEDRADATKATADAIKQATKDHDRYIADLEKAAEQVGDHVQKLRDEEAALIVAAAQNITLAQAIEQVTIARLEEDKAAQMSYGDEQAVAKLQAQIDKRRELISVMGQKATREADATLDGVPKTLKDVASYLDPAKAESFGEALKGAFGSAGDELAKLSNALGSYSRQQFELEQMQRAVAKDPSLSAEKRIKLETALLEKQNQMRLGAYADLAGAAKGFFDKNSAGYKVLSGIEKAGHLVQMAHQWERLYTSLFVSAASATGVTAGQAVETGAVVAGEATRNAAKVPGVFMSFMSAMGPWGAAAAAVAIAAVLGSVGGTSAPKITMDDFAKQKANDGSGTVFGDKTAQSESIANSLAALESMARPELSFTSQMVGLLRDINNSLAGTTNAILSSGFDLSGSDFKGSKEQDGGGIWGAIFGTESSSTTLSDLGLAFGKQTIKAAMQAIDVQSYQVTKTDWSASGFLGIGSESGTDYKSSFATVDEKVAASMSQVVRQLVTAVGTVGAKLGASSEQLAGLQNIDSGLGKVSLMGKSGSEVQEVLSAVFSAMGDNLAQAVMPDLGDFRQVGEGYLETLSRVAGGLDEAKLYTDKLGLSLGTLGDLGAKQGDVGAELVRASIANAEALAGTKDAVSSVGAIVHNFSGTAADMADLYTSLLKVRTELTAMGFAADTVSTDLLRGAGGLDALQSGMDDFQAGFLTQAERLAVQQASMDAAFTKLGLQTPKTAADFKELVYSLRDGGAASQELLGRVLVLSGGFADLVEAIGQADTALDKIKTTLKGLEGARAGALALAESAMQGVKDAIGDAKSLAQKTYDDTIKDLAQQETALTTAYELAVKAQNDIKDAATTARKQASDGLEAERKAAAEAYKKATGAIADERKAAVSAYKVASDAIKTSIDAANKSISLLKGLDSSLGNALNFFKQSDKSLQTREGAQAQLAAALVEAQGGKFPTAESLADALAVVTQPSEQFFANSVDYLRDFHRTASTLSSLSKATGAQLSTEERALEVMTASRDLMATQHEAHMERLDAAKEVLDAQYEALQALFDDRAESITGRFEASTSSADTELKRLKEQYDRDMGDLAQQRKDAKANLDDVVGKLDAQLGLAQKEYDAVLGLTKPLTDIASALARLDTALNTFKGADKAFDTAKVASGNPNVSSTDIKAFVDAALAKSTDGTGADAAALLYQYAVANGLSTNQIAGSGANPVLTQANLNNYTNANNLPGLDTLLTANGTDATNLANTATVKAADLVAATNGVSRAKAFIAGLTGHDLWQRELYDFAVGAHIPSADVDSALDAPAGTVNAWALANSLPAFELGTNLVPRDMVAQIHEGEAILPAPFNPERFGKALRGGGDTERLEALLEKVNTQLEALRSDQRTGHAQIATNTGKAKVLLDTINELGVFTRTE